MIIPFNTAMIPDIPRYTDSRFSARVGPIHLVESWNSSLDRTEEPDNPAEIFVSLTPLILRRPALSSLFATETSARRWRTKGDKREGANKKLAKPDFKTSREGIISSPSFVTMCFSFSRALMRASVHAFRPSWLHIVDFGRKFKRTTKLRDEREARFGFVIGVRENGEF